MQNKLLLILGVTTLLINTGCSYTQARMEATSGYIGCPPKKISIKDETSSTWTAICKDKTYYCSAVVGTGGASVSCKEEQ